jgi:hypothetical protein
VAVGGSSDEVAELKKKRYIKKVAFPAVSVTHFACWILIQAVFDSAKGTATKQAL